MKLTLWELRFTDGRGASLYTDSDVSEDVGKAEVAREITIATRVSQESALADARSCFEAGHIANAIAHMGSVAFAIRHEGGEA